MASAKAADAIKFFSDNARSFHENYEQTAAFKERLQVWDGILNRLVSSGGLALDMGCGSGIFSFRLAELGCRVIGIDAAPDMIGLCESERQAKRLDQVRFIQATLPNIDEAELAPADIIISSSVLEFVPDLDAVLALFARLAKPGAPLVISMPNARSISRLHQRLRFRLTGLPEVYRHIKHFSHPRAFAARAKAHGFRLEETHYYSHLTRVATLARRLRLPLSLHADLFVCVFRKSAA
jgi:2-polyprenyl-3-methyl-5-hydroxy-6-metoxy-1,4-benzoquinol methylase